MFLKPWTTPINDLLFAFKSKENNLKHSLKHHMVLRHHNPKLKPLLVLKQQNSKKLEFT